jgi:D-tyrosyl-tRNA(Tyr) deacylase
MLGGCAAGLLPVPLQIIGAAKTTYDVGATIADEQTTSDHIISEIVEKECKTRNILDGDKYCKINPDKAMKEYIEELKQKQPLEEEKDRING